MSDEEMQVLNDIKDILSGMYVMLENKLDDVNAKIDETNMLLNELKGNSLDCSVSDINEKLDQIKGDSIWNSISDVHSKLDDIHTLISSNIVF